LDVDIPRNQLVVITGLSGSGKSSLAFDTLYAEGQRRYVESLSTYARQFLGQLDKPDVDVIEGLSPAIAIEQKATSHNPRSTVGTVTEIHDYLRLLLARAGTPHCPAHGQPLQAQTISQMVDSLMLLPEGTRLMLLAPVVHERKGEFAELLAQLQAQGYVRFRIDGEIVQASDLAALPPLAKQQRHSIEVVVDRLKIRPDSASRLAQSLETALRLSQHSGHNSPGHQGRLIAWDMDAEQAHTLSSRYACPQCSYSLQELEPRLFSFNAPQGACPRCNGLGDCEDFDPALVLAHPSISLAGGAIVGWDERNSAYFELLQALAAHYGQDVYAPFESWPEAVQQVVLYGSGQEAIAFTYQHEGQRQTVTHPFEGVLPNLQRRWQAAAPNAPLRQALAPLRSSQTCPACHGTRLRPEALHVFIGAGEQQRNIGDINHGTLADTQAWLDALVLQGNQATIAEKILLQIRTRLRFLNNVGLGYLSLSRSADSLSGGEAQRIRLASQIGSGLSGVMYVLDEPSIGLHQRDNDRLIATLQHLRDLGNSVIVVEHDADMMRSADHIIDLGPGAGIHGGRIMAQGDVAAILAAPDSPTGAYLSGQRQIALPQRRTAPVPQQCLRLLGASGHNLQQVDVDFPIGLLTCVTGVSGSGKSTLVNATLYAEAARRLQGAHTSPAPLQTLQGLEWLDKVVGVDQAPIGRTPRSNPATYTGIFGPIRELFAQAPTARERGYSAGRFSFNVTQANGGGRCEACQGDGLIKVEMHFLPDVYVPCEVCHGLRYNRETLEVQWKGQNIAQVLDMTVEDALAFFTDQPALARRLQTLVDVGLGYIRLGQSATTLSGGEAQRVKLALELGKRDTGRTLYILDEPTTGLHFADVDLLLRVLHRLRDAGNTIVIIEHNLDVIKTADWVIDMGPEGGAGGGQIVVQGTPEAIAAHPDSHTGRYLRAY
ncbi:MAG: excinuclease ABC subunit UvrA, partial [Comamonas sp.]|nr:excinuclease ABC subunit UvrA [Comamonas sp.]